MLWWRLEYKTITVEASKLGKKRINHCVSMSIVHDNGSYLYLSNLHKNMLTIASKYTLRPSIFCGKYSCVLKHN